MVVMATLCIPSCASEQPLRGPRADEGQVYLYLSCPRKPAEDITFAISGMSFMNNHGVWIDVALERRIDSAVLAGAQIKLSEFSVPVGKYERMKWRISEAMAKRGAKTLSLALPEPGGEHVMDIEFEVFRRESLALFADWNPEGSIFNKYLFKN